LTYGSVPHSLETRQVKRYAEACELLLGAMSALPEEAEVPAELVRVALLAISFDIRPDSARPDGRVAGALAGIGRAGASGQAEPAEPDVGPGPADSATTEEALPQAECEGSPPRLGALSEREMGIAVLVSAGRTNQQIARALGLSNKTVETYLSRIFRKLDICSRSQIATLIGRAQAESADAAAPSPDAARQTA
jgi:DNA-binding CsgD family transcriptional regulator